MKKEYKKFDITVIKTDKQDVITTSSAETYDPSSTYDLVVENWNWGND